MHGDIIILIAHNILLLLHMLLIRQLYEIFDSAKYLDCLEPNSEIENKFKIQLEKEN